MRFITKRALFPKWKQGPPFAHFSLESPRKSGVLPPHSEKEKYFFEENKENMKIKKEKWRKTEKCIGSPEMKSGVMAKKSIRLRIYPKIYFPLAAINENTNKTE